MMLSLGLSYKLKAGASYVTNRRSVSYFASGGNTYNPNGAKKMKFNLPGDQWLDPNTFRVAFQLDNNNGNNTDGFQIMVQPLSWNTAVFSEGLGLFVVVRSWKILMILTGFR